MESAPRCLLLCRWARWSLFFAVYFGFWTSLGLFNVGQSYIRHRWADEPMDWGYTLLIGWADWYMWALLAPLIFSLSIRFPLDQRNWLASLPLHVLVSVVSAALVASVLVPIIQIYAPCGNTSSTFLEVFRFIFLSQVLVYLWIYWAILGACSAINYYRKYRERELHASKLETQLAQAQLQMLKMQLHPHFLFNTLNAISALMHKDVALADRMVARLGDLLRSTLENVGTQEVTVRQELEFIKPYLEIEQARFGPRLRVHLDVDPDAMDASVPNLILQPVVENAIRHGIAPLAAGGWIQVRVHRNQDLLVMEVQDNGHGLRAEPEQLNEGVGLTNTRARLRQLYGERQHLELANAPEGGLTVTIVIPFREDEALVAERPPLSSLRLPVLSQAAGH